MLISDISEEESPAHSHLVEKNGRFYVYKKMHLKPYLNGHTFVVERDQSL